MYLNQLIVDIKLKLISASAALENDDVWGGALNPIQTLQTSSIQIGLELQFTMVVLLS